MENHKVREVVIASCVQGGKSLLFDCWLPYVLKNDAGNTLLIQQTEDDIAKYSQTRLTPLLKSIKGLQFSRDRFDTTKKSIHFGNASLIMGGASKNNMQSLSYRYLIMDECWLFKGGLIGEGIARTTAFPNTKKILLCSQPSLESEDDEFYNEFKSGHMAEWSFRCPSCKELQPYYFNYRLDDGKYAGLTFDIQRDDNKEYLITDTCKTVRYRCIKCKHEIADTPSSRRSMNDGGEYVSTNKNCVETIMSFRWNALACLHIPWADLVREFLAARKMEKETGVTESKKIFARKRLAQFWSPVNEFSKLNPITSEQVGPTTDKIPNESYRFMTVDCQKGFEDLYYVIRAYTTDRKSVMLAHGKGAGFEDIAKIQKKYRVHDQWLGIDCGYNPDTVYGECARHGHVGAAGKKSRWFCWVPLMGTAKRTWYHYEGNVKHWKVYSPPERMVGVMVGHTKVFPERIQWSNTDIKNLLDSTINQKSDIKWSITEAAKKDTEYQESINTEKLVYEKDKRTGRMVTRWKQIGTTRPDYWDCENMNLLMAVIAGFASLSTKND